MKKFLVWVAGVMIVGVLVANVIYQMPSDSEQPIPDQSQNQSDTSNENHEPETSKPEPLQPIYVNNSVVGYSLQNDQLSITYDKGKNWITVPILKDSLFSGEYNGNKEALIENSYILTKNHAAFLFVGGGNSVGSGVKLIQSKDQGRTWQEVIVTENYPTIRFRKVGFVSDNFGFVMLSGDRTMSQEWSSVYITNDGGKQWRETNRPDVTRLIFDGGFVDETTGFLSFGILNPEEPDFYVTNDAGNTWTKSNILIPEEYHLIFVQAEVPFIEDDHLAVLINQGPNGDYKGGKVKGKFTSIDNGHTWDFSEEVEPNEPQP